MVSFLLTSPKPLMLLTMVSLFKNWYCMACLLKHLLRSHLFLQTESKLCVWTLLRPMWNLCQNGVPQGSVLGPLLFSIYINDLPLCIKACCDLFADDTTLHASHSDLKPVSESLQESVNSLIDWTELNQMSLHPSKTKFMLITTQQKRQNMTSKCPPLLIKHETVKEVDNHKVLRVTVDNNLSWSKHVSALRKTASKKVYQLSRVDWPQPAIPAPGSWR